MRIEQLWQRPRRLLWLIIGLSVALRVGGALYLGNAIEALPGIFDEISYHTLSLRLLDGYGFTFGEPWWPATAANAPTAHWSFLYTLYLAAVYGIFGEAPLVARLIQAVLVGVAMPWLIYHLALQVFTAYPRQKAEKIGLAAALITAVYVYLFYYAGALITESFYIVVILASFYQAFRIVQGDSNRVRDWLLLGLTLGTVVLLRQLFLLFVPFLLLWLWWAARPKIMRLVLPLVVIGAMIMPFTLRNYQAFDRVVLLNTNSGFAFFWGNHPLHGTQFVPIFPSGVYYRMIPDELIAQQLNEAELESELMSLGMAYVFSDPGRYILLSLSRIPPYFVFWPSPESGAISNLSRVASFGLFLPFMLYGLFLSLRQSTLSLWAWTKTPTALLCLFILFYTAVHVLTWTLIRYRIPIDALLILFAGLAVVDLIDRLWLRRLKRDTVSGQQPA